MIQEAPPAEIRLALQPVFRPWVGTPVPPWAAQSFHPKPFPPRRFELQLQKPKPWIGPVADELIWFGLTILTNHPYTGRSTWNTPVQNPLFRVAAPYGGSERLSFCITLAAIPGDPDLQENLRQAERYLKAQRNGAQSK